MDDVLKEVCDWFISHQISLLKLREGNEQEMHKAFEKNFKFICWLILISHS